MLKWLGFVFVALVINAEEKKDVSGWVVECRGDWEDRTDPANAVKLPCKTRPPKLWHPFGKTPKFVRLSPNAGESLSVRISQTGEVHKFNCDNTSNPCDPPPAITKLIPKEPSNGLLAAFLNSPTESYTRIRLMLSRSGKADKEPITIDHAVAAEGSVTYANLIRAKSPAADYLMELCPFDAENGCPRDHKPIKMAWKPGAGSTPWAAPVKPGLYEIVLSSADPISMRTKDRGLLLVVPDATLKEIKPQVEAGEILFLNEWKLKNEGKNTEEGNLMFRALLLHLVGTVSKP